MDIMMAFAFLSYTNMQILPGLPYIVPALRFSGVPGRE